MGKETDFDRKLREFMENLPEPEEFNKVNYDKSDDRRTSEEAPKSKESE